MQVVQDSAEHHFLTLLEKIKQDPNGWVGVRFAFSRKVDHAAMVSDLSALSDLLAELRDDSHKYLLDVSRHASAFENAVMYHFADNDVLLVARPDGDRGQEAFYALFKELSATTKAGLVDFISFARDMLGAQKLADRKMLAQKRMAAYDALSNTNQISSIGIRRQRRDHAVILIVEDDRFTATYTTGILAKNYDLVHSRTGEDAILDYIGHAPDIVFLDIHLPGLNGLETLHAIRQADPEAHVVMLSVDTAKTNVMTATHHGAAGFLKKPFSKDRILAIVEKSPFIRGAKSIVNRA
jgi:CheY-like chemotaxis protein